MRDNRTDISYYPPVVYVARSSFKIRFANRSLMSAFLSWMIDRAVVRRWWLLAIAVLLAAGAGLPASRLTYDRSIENLFASDDPLVASFTKLKRVFGRNEIVMVVYEDHELMEPIGQERLAMLAEEVRGTPGVASILSLATIPGLTMTADEGRAAAVRKMFERYTHGPDGRTAAVVTMLEPEEESPLPRSTVLRRLSAIAEGLPRGAIIGEPVLIDESFGMLESDSRHLLTWCAGLLSLTMLLTLRSIRWLACALAVVAFTVVTTRGLVGLAGLRMSLVSTMLPAVITVIGVATVMHVAVRHRQAVLAGENPTVAMQGALNWLFAPIAWACLTDVAGFASLLVSSVQPVQAFGLMMVAGSLLVLPAVVAICPAVALAGISPRFPAQFGNSLARGAALRFVAENPAPCDLRHVRTPAKKRMRFYIGLVASVAVCIASLGAARLAVETDFTRNFRADSPVVEAYAFVEQRLGGAGVWDIMLPAPPRLDAEYLARVHDLEKRLHRRVPHLVKTLSLADAVDALAGEAAGNDLAVAASLLSMKTLLPHFYDALYHADPSNPGRHYLRIMLRAPERMPADEKLATIARVRQIAKEAFPAADVTGYYVLLANLVTSLNRDQWFSLLVAAAGVFAMMIAAFRSVLLAAAALLVNVLPVLVLFGMLGWLGIPLNMGGAMSAAVSLGLAVDASIHFISVYKRAEHGAAASEDAVHVALGTVGRPVLLATAALVVGLLTLCGSEFVPTIHFGLLVSATMLGGLVGNLVLLPAILRMLIANRVLAS
jgi:predicted RND superfamily exporter protein